MTGGTVVVIGPSGRNFGAGMSGGVAYVSDEDGTFLARCNKGMVEVEDLKEPEDLAQVKQLLEEHVHRTASVRATAILASWPMSARRMRKVIPTEYRKVLAANKLQQQVASNG
jgi:glutamate synthase domain-containing protein 3